MHTALCIEAKQLPDVRAGGFKVPCSFSDGTALAVMPTHDLQASFQEITLALGEKVVVELAEGCHEALQTVEGSAVHCHRVWGYEIAFTTIHPFFLVIRRVDLRFVKLRTLKVRFSPLPEHAIRPDSTPSLIVG
jgi:hypothetical protein